ncbi:MAG: nucleoside triphosphate pyrophosphohydrolase [Alphaproteobacteria bacterium]|nr:nucleoside triphosphate pyrophosphohydrolase [Alphaproteobacteria bacterium]
MPISDKDSDGAIARLLAVMAKLRDPNGGCPWDIEQDFKSIAPHTVEETYEVVQAIENGDFDELKDELGDLLFQIVFYAQMAKERGLFDFYQIAGHVAGKMVSRHPHVFGDTKGIDSAGAVVDLWETNKAKERSKAGKDTSAQPASALDGVINALPAMQRSVKLQKRAARVGFDWIEADDILDKVEEEIGELRVEIEAKKPKDSGESIESVQEELGDLLFALTNLARRLEIDPEVALRGANRKFETRFRGMEAILRSKNEKMTEKTLEELENLWIEVKRYETKTNDSSIKKNHS